MIVQQFLRWMTDAPTERRADATSAQVLAMVSGAGYVKGPHTAHVPGGLYGICYSATYQNTNNCQSAMAPAYCSEKDPAWKNKTCKCPSGYTMVATGQDAQDGPATWPRYFYSCYKN